MTSNKLNSFIVLASSKKYLSNKTIHDARSASKLDLQNGLVSVAKEMNKLSCKKVEMLQPELSSTKIDNTVQDHY